ncbi:type II toxin-antitoxin system HipA family toxin [Pseudidiomarina sp. E22-M8]|uniref:type II toxin-antitoxin system HipA family toxin n=1 Tax=Pseudidiomarina sp. E22-M8 TaxID=3424768 RepID=UPI00403C7533
MISSAYVFIEGLDEEPVICGRFELDPFTDTGRFVYGRSYLARADAFALDPLHLPLTEVEHVCTLQRGIFGVLSDAGADTWGRKLILQLHKSQPRNELEFLIVGAAMGVGALSFSLSREKTKAKRSPNSMADLGLLLQGKNAIIADENISEEVKQAFIFGSSMGGARPKTLLTHDGQEYLVKFNKPDDLYNVARVEHATMRMLAELDGVRVADTTVITSENGEDVLMVKRFDREQQQVSHHFVSANSLLSEGAVNQRSLTTWYSYGQLAELLRQHSAVASDATELFQRMVFNVLIGNTDDHARNHAWLYPLRTKREEGLWHLAPAYDVLPTSATRQHALGIGEQGREGSVSNLLSQVSRFGLQDFKGRRLLAQVQELVMEWPTYMAREGVAEGDIEKLKRIIPKAH